MEIKANLTALITRLRRRGIFVVLAASRAPEASSGAYGRAFDGAFPAAAKAGGAVLAEGLLLGVLDRPQMRQADGLHPNAAGVAVMAGRLAPVVAHVLRRTPRPPLLRAGR
jgi:acyl-CoA thioesterase-1